MDAIPGLADLPAKLLSQCGIINGVFIIGIVWLALQLAKARQYQEADRAAFMKMFTEQNAAYEKLAVAAAKAETLLFALQSRGHSDD